MRNSIRLAAGLLSGVSLLAVASGAVAQAPEAAVEEIVVTGSRVIQNGNNMPTPVTVVTTEQMLQTTPSTVVQALTQMPVFAGGRSPQTNPGNSSQNNAARVLNLRNVGITRTLVLFDGRRVPPTSPLGEVNADFVPSMLLQRVDVVTGGASAVYGSDAVSGVVNFITDRNFNGYKVDAQVGRSERGDGDEMKIGVAGGMPLFDGRGHIEGSYEYYNSPGIMSKLRREWGRRVRTIQGAGTAANPQRVVEDTRRSNTSFMGRITDVAGNGPLRDMVFRQNGVLDRFQHGAATGSNGIESGGDGGYFYNSSLQSLFQSDLAFGRFDYDLTENVHFFAEATGMLTHNRNNHETNEFTNVTISAQNAFLAPQYQQALAAAGTQSFIFSKMMMQAPPKSSETYTRGYMATFGLEGDLGAGWRWDVSYLTSKNEQNTRNNANPNNMKAFAAMDAVRAPDGRIVCNVTLTHPGLYPGCVPINLFGPTSESAEALNYVLDVTKFATQTTMNEFGGSIAGSPFSTWAGEVGVAFNAQWRKLTYSLDGIADNQIRADCTGLRFNCQTATGPVLRWQSNVQASRSEVSQTVKEAAAEANVPLLRDAPLAESLTLNGAVRYTDYDTSGKVTTWKLGFDWDVNDQISIRGTRSRDIRAPNLNELFAPRLINPAGTQDRLINNQQVNVPFITDPNPDLDPEVAKTWTAGVVLRPAFIPRFSLAVDWYKIEIGNAITNIQGQNSTIQDICYASNGASEYCALIQRPFPVSNRTPANLVTAFFSQPRNAQVLTTNGIDFEANWSTPLLGGALSMRGLASYQPDLVSVQFPGAPRLDTADTPQQRVWRVTGFVKYSRGPVSVDVQQRWLSSGGWNADRNLVVAEDRLPAIAYTNLTLSYQMNRTQLYLTVSNLFDRQPSRYGGGAGVPGLFSSYIPGEDLLGRYFNVGFRLRH